jgi:hypothetical protein
MLLGQAISYDFACPFLDVSYAEALLNLALTRVER